MSIFVRCGKNLSRKDNLRTHLKKKYKCPPNYVDISGELMMESYDNFYEEYILKLKSEKNCIACQYCDKKFKYKSNCYRHEKLRCSVKKKKDEEKEKFMDEYLNTKYEQLKLEYETKNNEEKGGMQIKILELDDKLRELNEKNNILTQTIVQLQNSEVFDEPGISEEPKIHINSFGDEDLSRISTNGWLTMISKRYLSLQELVNLIHIKMEENRNVYIRSLKENFGMIYRESSWDIKDLDELLSEIVDTNSERIYDFIEANENKINKKDFDKVNEMYDKLGNDDSLKEKVKKKIKISLINKKSLIRKNYEDNYHKKLAIGGNDS